MKMSFLRKNGGRTFYVCTGSQSFCGCRYVKPRWFLAFLTRLGLVRPQHGKGSGARKRHNAYEKHGTNGNLTPYVKR